MSSINFQALISTFSSQRMGSHTSVQNVAMLFVALLCILLPLELSQLAFALIGALAYAAVQALQPRQRPTSCQLAAEREKRACERTHRAPQRPAPLRGNATRPRPTTVSRAPQTPATERVVKQEVYNPSAMPIFAPKFESSGWEAEVNELVAQITPSADENKAVQRLAQHVQQCIAGLVPEVEVACFAQGSIKGGKAFGVAVPEVDIVANVSPVVLAQRLQQRAQSHKLDVRKLQKSAIRACTDRLVSNGGLKFRRSAFRGEEPRVTLLVPSSLGFFPDAIPVDFSINSVTPFYTAALLTECGQIDARAKALILFVKRWAKDRGICHAAKGHLSPYLWSLLAMYFMQVGVEGEGPLLPALESFAISSGLMNKSKAPSPKSKVPASDCSADGSSKFSVGELFSLFVRFYGSCFDWTNEAVSVRLGRREPPDLSLPLHVVLDNDGTSQGVGPAIEDPFKAGNNLGACMNTVSLARLRDELARAGELCARGASLTELLEPWVPPEEVPERGSGSSGKEDEERGPASSQKERTR